MVFIYNECSACYWAAPNPNEIFHSGPDQRKQAEGVIVALLKIRAKQQRDNQRFSRAISLIMLLLYFFCGSQFVPGSTHGKILLSGLKPTLEFKDRNLNQFGVKQELDHKKRQRQSAHDGEGAVEAGGARHTA